VDVSDPGAKNMGSDLRGITADGFSIADRYPLATASQRSMLLACADDVATDLFVALQL